MSHDASVDSLFREHSFEEIETIRGNLAREIEKRTELLKSIVKEKYCDVVETSGAIHSMKLKLSQADLSIHDLDRRISQFYVTIKELPTVDAQPKQRPVPPLSAENQSKTSDDEAKSELIKQVSDLYAAIWNCFELDDLNASVQFCNEAIQMLADGMSDLNLTSKEQQVFNRLDKSLARAHEIIKNQLWYKIKSTESNQIGVIAASEDEDLYRLALKASAEFLGKRLEESISDNSYQAQIRRHQPYSYFNTRTNQLDRDVTDSQLPPATGHVCVPKLISIELSTFLYEICRVINTITGFGLTKAAILESLKTTVKHVLQIYSALEATTNKLNGERKRRRALQFYFDIMYIRVLVAASKNIDLIEELDPHIIALASKFELMLDSIEFNMISGALHANVQQLSQSTIRVYGLLIPQLQ